MKGRDYTWTDPGEWAWVVCTACGQRWYLTNYPFSVTLLHPECTGDIVREPRGGIWRQLAEDGEISK